MIIIYLYLKVLNNQLLLLLNILLIRIFFHWGINLEIIRLIHFIIN